MPPPVTRLAGDRYNATGGAISTTLPTTVYTYDADGNILEIAYPNGTQTDYNYSNMWNSSSPQMIVTNKNGSSTVLSEFTYYYNDQREKASATEMVENGGDAGSTTTDITWHYDLDGRLTDEISTDEVTDDEYHDHYDYDLAGNRVDEKIVTDGTGTTYTTENFYTYNEDGQLTTEADAQTPGTTSPVVNLKYYYDANGSLKETDTVTSGGSVTASTTYTYDQRNRMISMTTGGATTDYAYSDNGNRVGQSTGDATTTYVVDDNNVSGYSQVLETWTGAGTPATTYEVGATVISQTVVGATSGNGTQYIMPDGQGSTRQLTSYTSNSSNGSVVAREDYDGFGNSITLSGVAANVASTVILYTGQMWDPGLMMYDLRARLYEPSIGRFTSYDGTTISPGNTANANMYQYAGDNPVMFVDPTGHEALISTLAVLTIISVLTYGALTKNL